MAYRVCTANSNLNERRALYQVNPAAAQFIGSLDEVVDIGFQKYHGLKLSARRRTSSGLSLNGSYTLSRCTGTDTPNGFDQASAGYLNPDDPSFDDGYCDQDRKHLATLTLGYVTPMVDNAALRTVISNWRLSGIVSARTGSRIDIQSGRDDSFNGQRFQRPDDVGSDYYGEKTLTNYFDRAAFAQPTPGTLGNLKRNAGVGPNYWNVDLAISRLITLSGTQRVELRLESFNLFDHFNWGTPNSNFNQGTFGRITSMAGAPRIIQLGIKYDF